MRKGSLSRFDAQHVRREWLTHCWKRQCSTHPHTKVPGCFRTTYQRKAGAAAQGHVPTQLTRKQIKPTTKKRLQHRGSTEPNRKPRSQQELVPSVSRSVKAVDSFALPSKAVRSRDPKTGDTKDGDNEEASETEQSEDEDDLWDEIGEEIPAEWADEHAPSKHSGKPVQPGEYFTIVKGPKKSQSNPADPSASESALHHTSRSAQSTHSSESQTSTISGRQATSGNGIHGQHQRTMPANDKHDAKYHATSHRVSASAQHSSGAAPDGDFRSRHGDDARGQRPGGLDQRQQSGPPNPTLPPQRSSGAALPADFRSKQSDVAGNGSKGYNDRQLSNQHGAVGKAGRSPGQSESRAQRLKTRVLTGRNHTASTTGSSKERQHTGGSFASISAPSKPLQLKPNLDELGQQPGYFSDLLIAGDFLTLQLERHPDVSKESLGWQVNQCIVASNTWRGVLNIIRDLISVFDIVNMSTAMHRMAKLFKYSKAPSHMLLKHPYYSLGIQAAIEMAPMFEPRQLANVIWALATLRDRQSALLPQLDKRILEMDMNGFVQQELTNVIWAYGTMDYRQNSAFMQRAAQEMLERGMKVFMPQAISNACWAFAKHDLVYHEFLEVAGNYVAERLDSWDPQAIANIVWAYAKMEVCHDPLMTAVANNLTADTYSRPGAPPHPRIEDFKCQEISNVMLAFARLSTYNKDILQLVETEMSKPQRLKDSTQQGLVNVMWAFATLRYYPAMYFDAVVPHLIILMPRFNDQELSNCLWSFGRLAHHPGKLIGAFCEALDKELDSNPNFSLQATSNSLWAMAVLACAHNTTAMRLVQYLYSHEDDYLLDTQLHQTFQAVLLARIQAIMAGDRQLANRLVMPAKMQAQAVKCWKSLMRISRVSLFQQDVSDVVAALQIEHQMEYLAQDGLFSVDVAILGEDKNIAIEVDGPYHYTLNTHQPLGHTLVRRRLLTAMGWTVVSVPYFDWNRLQSGMQKAQYIVRLLDQHGFQPPSCDRFFEDFGGHEASTMTRSEPAVVNDSPGYSGRREEGPAPTYGSARVQDSAEMPSGAYGLGEAAHPIYKDTDAGRSLQSDQSSNLSQASTSLSRLDHRESLKHEAHQGQRGTSSDSNAEEAGAKAAETQASKQLQDVMSSSSRQTDQQQGQQDDSGPGLQPRIY